MRMYITIILTIGVMWLGGYGFANCRIFRIAIFTIFGALSAYYLGFMAIAEIGLWLDDKKRERKKERQGGK